MKYKIIFFILLIIVIFSLFAFYLFYKSLNKNQVFQKPKTERVEKQDPLSKENLKKALQSNLLTSEEKSPEEVKKLKNQLDQMIVKSQNENQKIQQPSLSEEEQIKLLDQMMVK